MGRQTPSTQQIENSPKTAYGAYCLELAKQVEELKMRFDEITVQEHDGESENYSTSLYDMVRYLRDLSRRHEARSALGHREIDRINKVATEDARAYVAKAREGKDGAAG